MNYIGRYSGLWVSLTCIIKTSLKLQDSKTILLKNTTKKKKTTTDGVCILTANPSNSPRLFSGSLTQEMRFINAKKTPGRRYKLSCLV